jgi:YmaF family
MEEKDCTLETVENVDQCCGECSDDRAFNLCGCSCEQTHVHEFLGSTRLAERCNDRHNHRFAGVTGEKINVYVDGCKTHVHDFCVNADYFKEYGDKCGHYHQVVGRTGPAIPVGDGKHVHFAEIKTTVDDGHCHKTVFATLIENPTA